MLNEEVAVVKKVRDCPLPHVLSPGRLLGFLRCWTAAKAKNWATATRAGQATEAVDTVGKTIPPGQRVGQGTFDVDVDKGADEKSGAREIYYPAVSILPARAWDSSMREFWMPTGGDYCMPADRPIAGRPITGAPRCGGRCVGLTCCGTSRR